MANSERYDIVRSVEKHGRTHRVSTAYRRRVCRYNSAYDIHALIAP